MLSQSSIADNKAPSDDDLNVSGDLNMDQSPVVVRHSSPPISIMIRDSSQNLVFFVFHFLCYFVFGFFMADIVSKQQKNKKKKGKYF